MGTFQNFFFRNKKMGIKQLTKLLGENAPESLKERELKAYFGRKIAIDASMSLYQFMIAVRYDGAHTLTDKDGETTSHLQGMFYRTIRMLDKGLKPVLVFDGKPPTLKSGELAKRYAKRAEATAGLAEAEETGNAEEVEKFSKRTVKVSRKHNEEAKRLLRLMGVPVIEAPCEAEATCAALARAGLVFAAGSEDMDTLTLQTPVLLRRLTMAEARKMPILEISLDAVLKGLEFNINEFVDLCILLGCDYCDSIRGIGPKRALELMQTHRSIEKILENIDTEKYKVPEPWPYKDARELFLNPDVVDTDKVKLEWTDPDEEGLVEFLVNEKGFNEQRIRSGVAKIRASRQGAVQGRLTSFFGPAVVKSSDTLVKKRAADAKARQDAKKAKTTKSKKKVAPAFRKRAKAKAKSGATSTLE